MAIMALRKIYGYVPPANYCFSSESEGLAHLAAALATPECSRYLEYVTIRSDAISPVGAGDDDLAANGSSSKVESLSKDSSPLRAFIPAYTLASWAQGEIDDTVYRGRDLGGRDSLRRWAVAMIEIHSYFRHLGVEDPIGLAEKKRLVSQDQSYFGWVANTDAIVALLSGGGTSRSG